jgi:hypothetical protein
MIEIAGTRIKAIGIAETPMVILPTRSRIFVKSARVFPLSVRLP